MASEADKKIKIKSNDAPMNLRKINGIWDLLKASQQLIVYILKYAGRC